MHGVFNHTKCHLCYASFLLISIFGWIPNVLLAQQSWTARGMELNWEMTVPGGPYGWIGGNYYQISEVLQGMDRSKPIELLKELLRHAKRLDAVLLRLDREGLSIPTTVKISVKKDGVPRSAMSKEVASQISRIMQKEQPPGAKVSISQIKENLTTGGYPAYQMTFLIEQQSGTRMLEVRHIIFVNGDNHIFQVQLDANNSSERLKEFSDMLESLRYK